jgi:hypothetical protein
MSMLRRLAFAAAAVLGALSFAPPAANAATLVLTQSNLPAQFLPPYGTLTVNLVDDNTASFSFQAATGYSFGGQGAFALNFAATNYLLSSIGWTPLINGTNPPTSVQAITSGNVGPYGNFNRVIDMFDGFTRSVTEFHFTLDNPTGTWNSVASIFALNNNNRVVADHIFAFNPLNVDGGAFDTGYATGQAGLVPGGQIAGVPEPATWAMMVLGFAGVGLYGMRKRRQNGGRPLVRLA